MKKKPEEIIHIQEIRNKDSRKKTGRKNKETKPARDKKAAKALATKTGGFVNLLGTSDALEVFNKAEAGDKFAKLVWDAMVYQCIKQVGAMAAAMHGKVDAILMGGGMCLVCYIEAKQKHYPKRDRMLSFKEILKAGKEAIWAIIMTAIILFGIMGGVMTPTEASIVCVCYGLIVAFFIYRKMTLKSFYACLRQTLSSAAAIMALVAFANVFAYILTKERIPNMIADGLLSITSNKYIILLLINLFLVFVGMFMETIAALLILFPVLLQVATAVGVDPIQFAIVVVMNLVLGLCTPPVGVCLFAATAIGGNKLSENVKALTPFLISNFTVLFLVTYVPALSVGVANLIMGV